MHDFMVERQIKIGQIIHPVRVAVTGKSTGLGMFDTLAILGKSSCMARIESCFGEDGDKMSLGI